MGRRFPAFVLLAGTSCCAFATAALAQADPSAPGTLAGDPQSPQAVAAPSAPAPAAGSPAGDIVVTGSRVLRNGAASPTPLTTISQQALAVAAPAGTISDALNSLPVFSGSRSQFSNPGSGATGVQGGNGAANVLNLRNLGFYRTLVLFDGHRIPPTLYNSAVDVDLIPQELISRVDVVTGGVSAVYGSDAVSGVVNYILDRKFTGFRGHAEAGISQRGDAAVRDVGLSFGTNLGDRFHFEASVQHRESDGIPYRVGTDRKWSDLAAVEGAGTTANPYHLVENVHLSAYTFGGLITSGLYNGQQFKSDGVLSPFVAGGATGSSCCQIGGDGAYQNATMASPSKSTQAFGRLDAELTDTIHAYAQVGANFKTNSSSNGWNQFQGLTLSSTNAFLPAAYQAALLTAGQSTFKLNEILRNGPRTENTSSTRQVYFNLGIEGSLGGFKWDATYTHGRSRLSTHVNDIPNNQRLSAALDAVVNPATGQTVCQASLTNPSAYGDCVPLNLFGPTTQNQAALNYVLGSVGFLTHTVQDSADASVRGSVFDTWAGPVDVALSGEWRKQSFDATSTATASQFIDCTGLRYNCTPTTPFYPSTYPNSPTISQSVEEGAIEIEVPLLKDSVIAKSLDLNAAARYTHYSTSGNFTTFKVGGVWAVRDAIKLRATYSHDIRAPTLYDLFQPEVNVLGTFTDTLTGKSVFVPSINNGNANLTAERGETLTGGIVLKPGFLHGVTLTVDAYHTTIKDAILIVQGFNAAVQAACYASGGSSPYCSLIVRPGPITDTSAANAATAFYIAPQNIGRIVTSGIDTEFDYVGSLFGRGLGLRLLANYQPHLYYYQSGLPRIDQGGAGWGTNGLIPSPSVQLSAFVNYKITHAITLDIFEKYHNKFRRSGVPTQVFSDGKVGSFASTNVTLTFDTGPAWKIQNGQFYVSVTNLFDKAPPLSGYYSGATSAGQAYEFSDDPTGRAFFVGFRVRG